MSSATPSPFERDHRPYLEDMLEFSEAVIAYTRGQTLASWQADPMRMDATLRKLTLIGETATRVPDASARRRRISRGARSWERAIA